MRMEVSNYHRLKYQMLIKKKVKKIYDLNWFFISEKY